MWRIRRMLSQNWTEKSILLWTLLREIVLKYPTASEEIHEKLPLIKELYITSGTYQNSYLYSQYSDFNDVVIDFKNDKESFRNSGRLKIQGESDKTGVWEMSEEESGLQKILRYPGMKDYFEEKRYATEGSISYHPNPYIFF